MNRRPSPLLLAAFFGGTGVMLGAFGTHGLRNLVDASSIEVWKTGVLYQLVHAIALLALGDRATKWCVRLWSFGILIFSGSLYLLVLLKLRWMGAVAPLGGTALILGWVALALESRAKPSA